MSSESEAMEVQRAIEVVGARAVSVSGDPVNEIRGSLERIYAQGRKRWPLWEVMVEDEALQDRYAWKLIQDFLPHEPGLLLFNPKDDASMFRFSDASDIFRVLSESYRFEFYITDEACSYLLCFNHHDFLIAAGGAVGWLKAKKRDLGITDA